MQGQGFVILNFVKDYQAFPAQTLSDAEAMHSRAIQAKL
jgi:hypothetical protein